MKLTQQIHAAGQSLWLDNITRELLGSGNLQRLIETAAVTGLTSNPTIFDHAIKNSSSYDDSIREALSGGKGAEDVFFDLALEDLKSAGSLFSAIHERTAGVDGWVSVEVSPTLANDAVATLAAAADLHARAGCANLFIKIPGTTAGLLAIEEAIFAGIPVNITLLFSRSQYLAAAGAYLRGIERRIDASLNPDVACVASLFISRWDTAVAAEAPRDLANLLGIAVGQDAYLTYLGLLVEPRWLRIFNAGGRPQRLLFASTGTKDPSVSNILYVKSLAFPLSINTMPEATLRAASEHEGLELPPAPSAAECSRVFADYVRSGVNIEQLGARLQLDGAKSFISSWNELLGIIRSKTAAIPATAS